MSLGRFSAYIWVCILAISAIHAFDCSAEAVTSLDVEYEPHTRIVIIGDDEFTVENGVRSGNGSPLDPYVIEGWEIDLSEPIGSEHYNDGLVIQNTRSSVIVRDVWIHDGMDSTTEYDGHPAGVVMYDAWAVAFEDCVISNNSVGMHLHSCRSVSIAGCLVSDSEGTGIFTEMCDYLQISDSVIARNSLGGVWMTDVEYGHLVDSTITGSERWMGVNLLGSKNCSVTNCNISQNENIGINIGFCEDCNLSENLIQGNDVGTCIYESERITMQSNVYEDNEQDIDDFNEERNDWMMFIAMVAAITAVVAVTALVVYRHADRNK